jgi:hypothetical protein
LSWKLLGGMPKAWILNSLLMFVLGFSTTLKLVSRALEVDVSVQFQGGSDERLKGVVWTSLSGILTQVEQP